ncbi:hypothetical protein [Streptomyces sp. NPDC056549]
MTTQQQKQRQAKAAPAEDTATAVQHAEATVAETIGAWPACRCTHHRSTR